MKGATLLGTTNKLLYCYFNPRTHEGCDKHLIPSIDFDSKFQSTHP